MRTRPFNHYNASGVMDADELEALDDALSYNRSAQLEQRVREMAALCASSCLASGRPWHCHFMEPLRLGGVDDHRDPDYNLPSARSHEVTVDVRGISNLLVATLLAEEQIRRHLAKFSWAVLPDLSASR